MLKSHLLSYLPEANPCKPLPLPKMLIIKKKCYLIFVPDSSKEIIIWKS